jgi:hypothetical protein
MRKSHGFAMVQAMALMVFIAIFVSVSMITTSSENMKKAAQAKAVTIFSAAGQYLDYALNDAVTDGTDSGGYNKNSTDYYDENSGNIHKDYRADLEQIGFYPDKMAVSIQVEDNPAAS